MKKIKLTVTGYTLNAKQSTAIYGGKGDVFRWSYAYGFSLPVDHRAFNTVLPFSLLLILFFFFGFMTLVIFNLHICVSCTVLYKLHIQGACK